MLSALSMNISSYLYSLARFPVWVYAYLLTERYIDTLQDIEYPVDKSPHLGMRVVSHIGIFIGANIYVSELMLLWYLVYRIMHWLMSRKIQNYLAFLDS